MAHLTSPSFQTRKRGHYDAFASGTDAALTDSPRKRRVNAGEGHSSYTVDIQRLSVKKKKNTYEDYFSEVPPSGFTYLPIGFRKIKEWCRDECLRQGIRYYVVSLFPNRDSQSKTVTNMITKNIYRHGWHFPQDLILAAFRANGLTNQQSVADSRNPILRQANPPPEVASEANLTDLFKDLFPGMPDKDIHSVINHAFQRGSGRVGDSEHVQYVRRVQLAVLAHIRHVYTDYDSRLKTKTNSRQLARLNIEGQCLSKLLKWRGEDDEFELEERDEEILIIEDSDDDSEDELAQWDYYLNGPSGSQDSDIEVVGYRDLRRNKERFRGDLPSLFYSPKFAGLAPRRSISRLPQTPQLQAVPLAARNSPSSLQQSICRTPHSLSDVSVLRNRAQTGVPETPATRNYLSEDARAATLFPSSYQASSNIDSVRTDGFHLQTSARIGNVRPMHAFGSSSWPRPVTVLLDSPSGIPQTVVDKHGNMYSFDQFNRTITPVSSPRATRSTANAAEGLARDPRVLNEINIRPSGQLTSSERTSNHSTFVGSDGQKYRLIPVSGSSGVGSNKELSGQPFGFPIDASTHSNEMMGSFSRKTGFQLMPANAHFIDLTVDESPARPSKLRDSQQLYY